MPAIITPATKMVVSHQSGLGVHTYDLLEELWSPDTDIAKSKVLHIASPKYEPNKTYAFDRSRYANHGTIYGASWKQQPSGIWVLSFDGVDDYVSVSDVPMLRLGNSDFTVAVWVKTAVAGGICGQGAYEAGEYYVYVRASGAPAVAVYYSVGGDTVAEYSQDIRDNQWHCLVGVQDLAAKTLTVYLEGKSGTPLDISAKTPTSHTGDVSIGREHPATPTYLAGSIGVVCIYNRALTALEVRQNYQSTKWRYS